ncbi:hypothetical protein [Peribacillus asahii]|uniref:hypothetical protein n=1 Tax=Peribacillus asahii TaxID=228899 RepID=UPI00338E10CA
MKATAREVYMFYYIGILTAFLMIILSLFLLFNKVKGKYRTITLVFTLVFTLFFFFTFLYSLFMFSKKEVVVTKLEKNNEEVIRSPTKNLDNEKINIKQSLPISRIIDVPIIS